MTENDKIEIDLLNSKIFFKGEQASYCGQEDSSYHKMHSAMFDDTDLTLASLENGLAIDSQIEEIERLNMNGR
jgi:hypothetical protein